MKKLFIIGNGFDIAHNLPTKYTNFRDYLIKICPNASCEYLGVPESFIIPNGDEVYNDDEVVCFLLKIIAESEPKGNAWSDLEKTLGILNFDMCFDDLAIYDDDDNEWRKVCRNEDIAANVCSTVQMIKRYFSDWINTINISTANSKINFSNLIDPNNDLFLTFNYTKTLEYLYNAKNVYHIHGKQGDNLVFGHGSTTDCYEEYMNNYIGAENYLSELILTLKKDTQSIIKQNKNLFIKLSKVDAIYSYGFSFSDVDMAYIIELCNLLKNKNIIWYLHDFDKNKATSFKEKIIKCGFKGKFGTFTI